MSIEDQVRAHINEKYLGSKDIEVTDSIDFCEYFEKTYGDVKEDLKDKFLKIEADLRQDGWNPQRQSHMWLQMTQMISQNSWWLHGSLDSQRRTASKENPSWSTPWTRWMGS